MAERERAKANYNLTDEQLDKLIAIYNLRNASMTFSFDNFLEIVLRDKHESTLDRFGIDLTGRDV